MIFPLGVFSLKIIIDEFAGPGRQQQQRNTPPPASARNIRQSSEREYPRGTPQDSHDDPRAHGADRTSNQSRRSGGNYGNNQSFTPVMH